jgi:ankyrin repeat protein
MHFPDEYMAHALFEATYTRRVAVVKLLVEYGAQVNTVVKGQTPLTMALRGNQKGIVDVLLKMGLMKDPHHFHATALQMAVQLRHFAVAKLLLKRGADIESRGNCGRTPLSFAVEEGRVSFVECFLERGAEVETKDDAGRTPLSWAAESGYPSIVELLLKEGAIVESVDNSGRTPLSWAAENGRMSVVRVLLKNGAVIQSVDKSGRTPLSYAAESSKIPRACREYTGDTDGQLGRLYVVQFLTEKSADMVAEDMVVMEENTMSDVTAEGDLDDAPPVQQLELET